MQNSFSCAVASHKQFFIEVPLSEQEKEGTGREGMRKLQREAAKTEERILYLLQRSSDSC